MPRTCVAVGCNSRYRKGSDISFHRFPRDEKITKEWVVRLKRGGGWKPTKASHVCSKHFTSDCYESSVNISRDLGVPWQRHLQSTAVPTIFAHTSVPQTKERGGFLKRRHAEVSPYYSCYFSYYISYIECSIK